MLEAMGWLAGVLSGSSLVAVVIIGWRTLRLGERSTAAAERSADAANRSAVASERAAGATLTAAAKTERSVAASQRAARLGAQDARVRHIEAALDVALEIRPVFSDQVAAHARGGAPWVPGYHSFEALMRLALARRLEARLMATGDSLKPGSPSFSMITSTYNWSSGTLEGVINHLSKMLAAAAGADPSGSSQPPSWRGEAPPTARSPGV